MVDRDQHAGSPDPGKPVVRTGAFLVGTLLCLAAPHVALGAAGFGSGCDTVARELKSAEIPVESLTADIVDHMTEDHGAADPVIGNEQDPTAPLLFLTPRVAHILQDVFGDAETPKAEATPMVRVRQIMLAANAAAKTTEASQPATKAPLSGGGETAAEFDGTEPAISSGPLTETFYDVDTLPRFQQRMFRNDI